MDDRNLQSLIEAWYDGTLDESGKTELERLLLTSPESRRLFWETAEMHSLLCAAAEADPIDELVLAVGRVPSPGAPTPAKGTGPTNFDSEYTRLNHPSAMSIKNSAGSRFKWWKVAAAAAGIAFFSIAGTLLFQKYILLDDVQVKEESVVQELDLKEMPVQPAVEEKAYVESVQVDEPVRTTPAVMDTELSGAVSSPVQVYFSPVKNRMWSTICSNAIALKWEWPPEAAFAQLEIHGMNGSSFVDFNEVTTNYLWHVFSGSIPRTEDVYSLTLTFYVNGYAMDKVLNSKLAVVKGAFGMTTVDFGPSDRRWSRVRDNVVIPYDATWLETTSSASNSLLTISKRGGMQASNMFENADGWIGWNLKNGSWGYGTFDLLSAFPGFENEWTATLVRVTDGTLLTVR